MEFDRKKVFDIFQDLFSSVVKIYLKVGKDDYFDFVLLFVKIGLLAESLGFTIDEFKNDMLLSKFAKMFEKRS